MRFFKDKVQVCADLHPPSGISPWPRTLTGLAHDGAAVGILFLKGHWEGGGVGLMSQRDNFV